MNTVKTIYKSPLRYPGGKQKAISAIAAQLPDSVNEYREPLVGGGSVFLYARSIGLARKYWINDKFHELICFWQSLQSPKSAKRLIDDLDSLHKRLNSSEAAKKYFLRAKEEQPSDLHRKALLFFFFNRVTFSGTTRAGGFSSAAAVKRFTVSSIKRLLPITEALQDVHITELEVENVISEPGKDVFIFLDPPYFTATKLYGHNGSLHKFDHEKLAHALKQTGHRFLITYDDCPEIRRLYRWCNISDWNLQYGMNNCNSKRTSKIGAELFISNY